jgi:hypothetical protein
VGDDCLEGLGASVGDALAKAFLALIDVVCADMKAVKADVSVWLFHVLARDRVTIQLALIALKHYQPVDT